MRLICGRLFVFGQRGGLREGCRGWKQVLRGGFFVFGRLGEALNDPAAAAEKFRPYMRDEDSFEMMKEYILPGTKMVVAEAHFSLWDLYNDLTWDVYGSLSVEEAVEKYAPQFEAAVAEAFRRFNR